MIQNNTIVIQKKQFGIGVFKMSAMLSRPQSINLRMVCKNYVIIVAADTLVPCAPMSPAAMYWQKGKYASFSHGKVRIIIIWNPGGRCFVNDNWNVFPLMKIKKIQIQILLTCVFSDPVNNKTVLVQIITCWWTHDKPLSEPMIVGFTDAYFCHSASVI